MKIAVQLFLLTILQQFSLSFCSNFDSSSSFEYILIIGGVCTFCCMVVICHTCFCIAVLVIKSIRNETEEDFSSEDQDSSVIPNIYTIEPPLNYADVVNMDSLPPYIPGYSYNPNIVNSSTSVIFSTAAGEFPILTQVAPTNTQEYIYSSEIYTNLPSPPPYISIS